MVPAPFIVVVDANVLFPLPDGLEAQSPDDFLCNLFDLNPAGFVTMLRAQAADLHKPPVTFDQLLERLGRPVPDLVKAVREHIAVSDGS